MRPILRRELLALLRTRQALGALLGLAVASAALVLVRWPTGGVAGLGGAPALQVLRVFGYGLLACLLLVLPAFPAVSLVREKVRGTLALLLNSPLSASAIIAGKLGAVLGFTALLLVMTLPGAAACFALGGSTISGGVGLLYVVLAAVAVEVAALGLLVSARSQSIDGALRATYGLVLALTMLPFAAYWLLRGGSGLLAGLAPWFGALSPLPAVMEVVGHGAVGARGMAEGGGAVVRYLMLAVVVTVGCVLATMVRLVRAPLDVAKPAGVMTEDRSTAGRVLRRLLFLVDPRRRSGSISLLVNPVMVKEFRTRRFGRSHWTLRLLALSAILSLGLCHVAAAGALGWGIDAVGGALVLFQAAVLILFAPSLAAGLISAEREGGGWQLLRMTPLSSGAVLRGKLLSVAWPLMLLLCATLPGYVVVLAVRPDLAPQVQRVVTCLVLTAVFAVLVSAAASSLFRSTAAATAAAYAVLVGTCVAPLLVWLGREAPFGHRTVQAALTIDPVAAALHAFDAPGFTSYELVPANWWAIGVASVGLLAVLVVRARQLYRPE